MAVASGGGTAVLDYKFSVAEVGELPLTSCLPECLVLANLERERKREREIDR